MSGATPMPAAALLQHGQDYAGQDITGWHLSEKLNGCRAYWDGETLYSKSGRPIHAPHITQALPRDFALDGELYAGRGNFEIARQFTQYGKHADKVRFVAFDAPCACLPTFHWPLRLELAARSVEAVKQLPSMGHAGIADMLREVLAQGGEGLMARRPGRPYTPGRGADVLKLKSLSLELLAQADEVPA